MPSDRFRFMAAVAALDGLLSLSSPPAAAPQAAIDPPTLGRITAEATQNSRVMEHLFYLADVYGPRLIGSPGFSASGEWAGPGSDDCLHARFVRKRSHGL